MAEAARAVQERRANRLVALLALLAVGASAALAWRDGWALSRDIWLVRCTGWGALVALGMSLCVTPASNVTRRLARRRAPAFAAYRRALGLVAAALATIHLALVLGTYLRGAWGAIVDRPYLRSGLTALVILILLAATSFPRLVSRAGIREWKPLHRLAYVAGLLAMHHVLLSPFAPRVEALVLFAVVAGGGLLRVVRVKRAPRGP